MTIAYNSVSTADQTTNQTSVTVDITAATAGEWVYAFFDFTTTFSGATITFTGWTSVLEVDGDSQSHTAIWRRKKVSGDTTFSVTWATSCRVDVILDQWTGLDPTTPDEGAAYLPQSTSTTNAVTPSATPTAANRWSVTYACHKTTTTANKAITWTPDAAQVKRTDFNTSAGASSPWLGATVCDSNGAVTHAAHSYIAVAAFAEAHGGAAILFLIPAAGGTTFAIGNGSDGSVTSTTASLVLAPAAIANGADGSVSSTTASAVLDLAVMSATAASASTASGTAVLDPAAISAAAVSTVLAAGTVVLDSVAASGASASTSAGTGGAVLDPAVMAAGSASTSVASGTAVLDPAVIAGSGTSVSAAPASASLDSAVTALAASSSAAAGQAVLDPASAQAVGTSVTGASGSLALSMAADASALSVSLAAGTVTGLAVMGGDGASACGAAAMLAALAEITGSAASASACAGSMTAAASRDLRGIMAGPPYTRWSAGAAYTRWAAGQPYPDWAVSAPGG